MRAAVIICLVGGLLTVALGAMAAGVDFGSVAIVANAALIYGLTAALR